MTIVQEMKTIMFEIEFQCEEESHQQLLILVQPQRLG